MIDERTSALIADIYAGMHDAAVWNRAVDTIIQRCGVDWALVGTFDDCRQAPIAPAFHRIRDSAFLDGIAEYDQDIYRIDPTNRFAARMPSGGVFDSLVQLGGPDYLDHEFVRWQRSSLGSTTWRTHYTGSDGLQLGVSLHSSDTTGPLGDEAGRLFAMLFGHIKAAAWSVARAVTLEGGEPVILLDGRGCVAGASEAAKKLLAQGDGLKIIDGQPRATARYCQPALNRAIRSALDIWTEGSAGGAATLDRSDGTMLYVTVTPLPPSTAPFAQLQPAAQMRLVDPQPGALSPTVDWNALFGFTPAETRLARALLAGDGNLRTVADALGIAYATARVQLSSLFDKAGVRSQAQLVRLLTKLG